MGTVRKGKVKLTEKEKAMGLKKAQAGGECRPGRVRGHNVYENGIQKTSYKKNKIIFTEEHIDEIWDGTRPLEDINHEVIHANDMLDASWWDDPKARKLIYSNIKISSEKISQWMDIKAYRINYQRTGDIKYLEELNKVLKIW